MTKEDIIKSGLLEQYASGLLSAEEEQEMEEYFTRWPSLRSHVVEMQNMLNEVGDEFDLLSQQDVFSTGRIIRMKRDARQQKNSPDWKKLFQLLTGLVLLFVMISAYFFYQTQSAEEEISAMQRSLEELQENLSTNQENLKKLSENYGFFSHPNTFRIPLKPVSPEFSANVIAYYNIQLQSSFINIIEIPTPQSGTDYQLWADVEGKMIDMGKLLNNSGDLVKLPYIDNANALNVTIENQDGNADPNLEAIVMHGDIGR